MSFETIKGDMNNCNWQKQRVRGDGLYRNRGQKSALRSHNVLMHSSVQGIAPKTFFARMCGTACVKMVQTASWARNRNKTFRNDASNISTFQRDATADDDRVLVTRLYIYVCKVSDICFNVLFTKTVPVLQRFFLQTNRRNQPNFSQCVFAILAYRDIE